jgi:UDP-glucuronate 4-epimerase
MRNAKVWATSGLAFFRWLRSSGKFPMHLYVTGAPGFVGYHVSRTLLEAGHTVHGVDNLNAYYSPVLKDARLNELRAYPGFTFEKLEISDMAAVRESFHRAAPTHVIHLAAQAGVRYSLEHPEAYTASNVAGFINILEACRHDPVKHLVYASSSSVYGLNLALPFRVGQNVDHPVSLYAATKKSNELLAHAYSHLFQIPVTGLRFFTVYGTWGRPDMATWKFARAILKGEPIDVYNNGQMRRDFTYAGDIAQSILRLVDLPAQPNPEWDARNPDPATSPAPYRLYNIGNREPVLLLDFIRTMEEALGKKAEMRFLPLQPGDVLETEADVTDLARVIGEVPSTPLAQGLKVFADWFKAHPQFWE